MVTEKSLLTTLYYIKIIKMTTRTKTTAKKNQLPNFKRGNHELGLQSDLILFCRSTCGSPFMSK